MKRLTQHERDNEFALLLTGDATDGAELLARHVIVASCGAALWFATGEILMLLWGLGYFVLNSAYVGYLKRQSVPIQPRNLAFCVAGSTTVAIYFTAMVPYVAFLNEGELLMLAVFGSIGVGLHCLSRNSDFSYSCYVDVAAAAVSFFSVTIAAFVFSPSVGASVAICVGAVAVIGYFLLSFRQIIVERKTLAENLAIETQSQKLRALGQLTSGIAHDFNNLLTVVRGNIELASVDDDRSRTKTYLDNAHEAAGRGTELVQQLLAYARKSRLRQSDIELGAMLERVQSILTRVLPAHIALSMEMPEDELFIHADAALLESALLNLVINARDAVGPAKGRIRVSAKAQGSELLLTVTDTGPGMDDKVIQRATEPFFTTKTVGEGSGLGLSMVKGFARQSGGELRLQNSPETGFSAVIELPLGRGAAD